MQEWQSESRKQDQRRVMTGLRGSTDWLSVARSIQVLDVQRGSGLGSIDVTLQRSFVDVFVFWYASIFTRPRGMPEIATSCGLC